MYCLFCHRESNIRKVCLTCRTGFVKWVTNHTNIKSKLAVHKALASVPFTLNELPKWTGRNWPGFYTNNGLWSIPDHYYVTDQDVTWENAEYVVFNLLNKHGINQELQLNNGHY